MERESMIFRRSWLDSITDNIKDTNEQKTVVYALIVYGLTGKETDLPKGNARAVYQILKMDIDKRNKRQQARKGNVERWKERE